MLSDLSDRDAAGAAMLCCAVSQLAMRAVSQASYAVRGLAAMLCGLAELQRCV